MVRSTLEILALTLFCGSLLVLAADWTTPHIERNRLAEREAVAGTLINPLPDNVDIVAPVSGACEDLLLLNLVVAGYAGDIQLLARWQPGSSVALRVVAHQETPGIGDFIDLAQSPWIKAYDDLQSTEITQIDGVGRATITTNAIKHGFERAFHLAEVYCARQ